MPPKISDQTWVIIPAHNEEVYLSRVLDKLCQVTSRIIVVDDGSSDATYEVAVRTTKYVLHHRLNLGKGAALRTGCDFAFEVLGAAAIIMMDADDQHQVSDVDQFWQELDKGFPIVYGVRQEPAHMPWLKLKLNRLSSFVTYLLFGRYILDIPSGFKALSKEGYHQLRWQANDYAVELEIAARTAVTKTPMATVPIQTVYHDHDKGMTAFDALKGVRYLLQLRMML